MNAKANSKGQSLKNHLIAVSKIAEILADRLLIKPNDNIKEACRLGGLLHDVGKVDPEFRQYLSEVVSDPTGIHSKPKYFHNEVSLAIFDYLERNNFNITNLKISNLIRNSIYLHHPERNDKEITEPSQIEIAPFIDDIIELLNDVGLNVSREHFEESPSSKFPTFLHKTNPSDRILDQNYTKFFVLSVVNQADLIVSSLSQEQLDKLVEYGNYESAIKAEFWNPFEIDLSASYVGIDTSRMVKQKDIASESLKYQTTQVNAPAGFGKTLVMLFRILQSGKRTYIVCPRNFIAENVYKEIKELLGIFGIKMDLELYYGSNRVDSNENNASEKFESQIVITNIDSYAKTFNHPEMYYRSNQVATSDLIIDEYDELISDSPMFALTVEILKMRHFYIRDGKTLLLSATHARFSDMISNDVVHLPSKGEHYPAAHKMPYELKYTDREPVSVLEGEVCIWNSIKNVQAFAEMNHLKHILHSYYIKPDMDRIKSNVLQVFGKHGEVFGNNNEKMVASRIMQASLNISFRQMVESLMSPEATIQRLGRTNRFGEYTVATFSSFYTSDKGETAACKLLYGHSLRLKWARFWERFCNAKPEYTLDEIYEAYNKFQDENAGEIVDYNLKQYNDGINDYIGYEMAPKRQNSSNYDPDVKEGIRSARSLRDPEGGYFVVPLCNGKYLEHELNTADAMNIQKKILKTHWDKNNLQLKDDKFWKKEIQKLIAVGYRRWGDILQEYEKYGKRSKSGKMFFTTEKLLDCARWSETPLPGFNYEYSKRLGLIEKQK